MLTPPDHLTLAPFRPTHLAGHVLSNRKKRRQYWRRRLLSLSSGHFLVLYGCYSGDRISGSHPIGVNICVSHVYLQLSFGAT